MFFQETAEELVNRLFDDFLEIKSFAINVPLLPHNRQDVISRLEKFDKELARIFKDDGEETAQTICLRREKYVLFDLATTYAGLFKKALTSPSPKPTHRQQKRKDNHLRLVVNQ